MDTTTENDFFGMCDQCKKIIKFGENCWIEPEPEGSDEEEPLLFCDVCWRKLQIPNPSKPNYRLVARGDGRGLGSVYATFITAQKDAP